MRAGFIGAGKVGFSLGKYLTTHGVTLSGYYSRSCDSAKEAAEFTESRYYTSLAEITEDSDTLFITTPDGVIGEIWDDMRNLQIRDKNICHCSGSVPSTAFFDAEKKGAFRFSIHPLYAVSSRYTSYQELGKACFTIEGTRERLPEMKSFFETMGNRVVVISPESKTLYHAAAVMVSNQLAALVDMGADLLRACGFPEQDATRALSPLIEGNALAVAVSGPVKALTGPCERGDVQTVAGHLAALQKLAEKETSAKDIESAYRILSRRLVSLAERKNPQKNYMEPKKELEQ